MPNLAFYEEADWNACCDQCGRPFKFSNLRLRWDSAWTCEQCWEPRQPQDFVRGVKDDSSVPVGRPRILNLNYNLLTEDGFFFLCEQGIGVSRIQTES